MLQRTSSHSTQPFRLVVETDDPSLSIADFVSFAAAGFDVTCCGGPRDGDTCPAVEGRPCALLDGADVVLNQLTDAATQRAVVDGVRRSSPKLPMVVGLPRGGEFELPDGCVPLSAMSSVNGQVMAVRRAATRGRNGNSHA